MSGKAFAFTLLANTVLFAHCDTVDGPVVQAARRALSTGDVNIVLPWIPAAEEGIVREVFERARTVRGLNPEARKLADTWLFETVVRVHRQGENAPYTGLKPAGELSAAIAATDEAIQGGDVAKLEDAIVKRLHETMRQRFSRVLAAKRFEPADVKAGREYVRAYVDLMHLVERLDKAITTAAEHSDEHSH